VLLALTTPSTMAAAAATAATATGQDDTSQAASPLGRVIVLGARGGTGRLVLKHLKEAGAGRVVAVARNTTGETGDDVIEWAQGDVKDAARMAGLFEGASAVVFAASASEGWSLRGTNTPKHVDYEAVVRASVRACGM